MGQVGLEHKGMWEVATDSPKAKGSSAVIWFLLNFVEEADFACPIELLPFSFGTEPMDVEDFFDVILLEVLRTCATIAVDNAELLEPRNESIFEVLVGRDKRVWKRLFSFDSRFTLRGFGRSFVVFPDVINVRQFGKFFPATNGFKDCHVLVVGVVAGTQSIKNLAEGLLAFEMFLVLSLE
ncbi:hypothetical protein CVT25_006859 [Psilocybe cyanescens]|uniref:Uncharacterized protein n=1 Tax=Psilocybe cyanescens TaxID=93625 RepID=A0A409XTR7_PSICY|nr:hypothetical protein CVT25_006859 [Psilocybe cyanescens]